MKSFYSGIQKKNSDENIIFVLCFNLNLFFQNKQK